MNEKIIECIKLYIDDIPEDALIIKSNLVTATEVPKEVRVFSMMELINDPEPKAISNIVLIDPFHLVIPSEYKGMSKQEMEKSVFYDNASNNICMLEYVKSI